MAVKISKSGKSVLITNVYAGAFGEPINVFVYLGKVSIWGDTFTALEFQEIIAEGYKNIKTGLLQINW